jgi:hypothetical protein
MLDTKALAEATAAIVREHVDAATAPLIAENKALAERIAALEAVEPQPGEKGEPGPAGEGVDPETVASMIAEAVERAVAALPPAEKGGKGDPGERGERGPAGEAGAAGEKGADGKDGCGIKDLLIDRDGAHVATMDDGRTKSLGIVVGKDGEPGKPGSDGADGFGLDDFDIEPGADGRTVKLLFTRGEVRHAYELQFPVMIYREVYQEGAEYQPGDTVTWGGSLWVAQRATNAKPDGPESGWRLAVKRGRDGKDKA